jgi:pimeloyl-ACP methyl ester carboxylesterase
VSSDAALSERLRAWRRGGRSFTHGGHTVFFKDEGHGPTVLLLHGYPTGSYDWHALWPLLTPQCRLIAPDMIGLGFSDKPTDWDYTLQTHADMHEALLQHLGLSSVHVVAHDLGVSVAQEMLARRLEGSEALPRIQSLTLLNGGLCPEAYRPRRIQQLLATPLGAWLGPRLPEAAVKRALSELMGDGHANRAALLEDFWQLVCFNDGRRIAHQAGRFWRDRLACRDRLVGALLARAMPLRLINGAADPNSGQHMAARFKQLMPEADIVSLAQVGHWPQIEAASATAGAILNLVFKTRDYT